jgi:hypothetical protein
MGQMGGSHPASPKLAGNFGHLTSSLSLSLPICVGWVQGQPHLSELSKIKWYKSAGPGSRRSSGRV